MKTIRILANTKEIEDACHLLYKVYIENVKWNPAPDNPSKIRVETRNNKKLLIDRFSEIATWFGIFDHENLVGCARIQGLDENQKLELEGYSTSEVVQPYLAGPREKIVELAKLAIFPDHVSPGIIKKLCLAAFKFCEERGYSAMACTHNSFLRHFFQKIGFPLKIENAFKFEVPDPHPVNFYFADFNKGEIDKIIGALESGLKHKKVSGQKIFDALAVASPLLPVPVYWHDKNGVVLGINEQGLKGMGTSPAIIGKTPYDFYPRPIAERILQEHKMVMDSGNILIQEERLNDFTTGKKKYFSSIIAPLYDDDGLVIGIVGTALDITAEKESERLKIENEKLAMQNRFQNKLIEEQRNFKAIIDQAVHDIRSPLASLMIVANYTKNIPQDFCAVISGASRRINDIANNLLQKYKSINTAKKNNRTKLKDTFQVLLALFEIVSEKKYEFHNQPVEFKISQSIAGYSAHVLADEASIKRMISNLINNAVESFEKKPGVVELSLDCQNDQIIITLKDNGKGMSTHVLSKVRKNIPVTEGKSSGYGIGFTQVAETLRQNDGNMKISSIVGEGTSITLTLPKTKTPAWVQEVLTIEDEDIILVLDDQRSIHKVWDLRLKEIISKSQIMHFDNGADLLRFANNFSREEKEKALLLADFELLYQDLNGLEIIEKAQIKRSTLVTSHYANNDLLKNLKKTHAKLLPKIFVGEIPLSKSS